MLYSPRSMIQQPYCPQNVNTLESPGIRLTVQNLPWLVTHPESATVRGTRGKVGGRLNDGWRNECYILLEVIFYRDSITCYSLGIPTTVIYLPLAINCKNFNLHLTIIARVHLRFFLKPLPFLPRFFELLHWNDLKVKNNLPVLPLPQLPMDLGKHRTPI